MNDKNKYKDGKNLQKGLNNLLFELLNLPDF